MSAASLSSLALSDLRAGESAIVAGLGQAGLPGADAEGRDALFARLRDIGFHPGARCEVIARNWLFGGPVAVRIGGSTFALRRVEAEAVRIEGRSARA